MPKKFFGDRSKLDAMEGAQNAKFTRARALYKNILEDLDPQHFTLTNVVETLNALTKTKSSGPDEIVRFGQSDLNLLVRVGLIKYDREERAYRVVKEDLAFAYPEFLQDKEERDYDAEQDIRDSYEFMRDQED